MPTAAIRVNTLVPPQDVPLGIVVNLSNAGTGGEVTFSWVLVDQPAGPADVLLGGGTATPTITPTKEGSYLILLTVNAGQNTQQVDVQKFRVLNLVDGRANPAAGETTQQNLQRGWAESVNEQLSDVTSLRKDAGRVAGSIAVSGAVPLQTVLYVSGVTTIKVGFPGVESVPTLDVAEAANFDMVSGELYLLDRGVVNPAAPVANEVVWARLTGMVYGALLAGATIGDVVYVDDAGLLSLAPGTYHRNVGRVVAATATTADLEWNGTRQLRQVGSLLRLGTRGAMPGAIGTKWPLAFGFSTIAATDGASIVGVTAGVPIKYRAAKPGRWSRLYAWCSFNADPIGFTLTAYKNGVATLLSTSLASSGAAPTEDASEDVDEAHAFTFEAGDYVELRVNNDTAITTFDEINGMGATVYEQLFD